MEFKDKEAMVLSPVAIFPIETNRVKALEVFGDVYCRYPSA
jgi:hypothetical protein